MGLGGLVTGIMGATGNSPKIASVSPTRLSKDYLALINGFSQGQSTIFDAEEKWKPKYLDLEGENMGRAADIVRGVTPGATALFDKLDNQAEQGLDAGASLDPALARVATQSIRQGQAARGLGYGPADVLQESSALTSMGERLRERRQDFAASLAPAEQNSVLPGAMALNQGAQASIIPASQSYDVFNTAYNAKAAQNIGNANNKTAMLQGFNSFD